MIKLIPPAEDAVEKLSIDNTNNVVLVGTQELKLEDVFKTILNLDDGWGYKVRSRKGLGTGRMRHLKDVPRKFRNGFRAENTFVKAIGGKKDNKTGKKAKVPRRRLK